MNELMLTATGFDELGDECARLSDQRLQLGSQLRTALEFGGASSENGEYIELRREIEFLDHRIAVIEQRLSDARVVHPRRDGEVDVGEEVTATDVATGETHDFRIVGSGENTFGENRVSYKSPVGAALLGRRAGEVVSVDAPGGTWELEIVAVDG